MNLYLPDAPPDQFIDPPCYSYVLSDGERAVIVDTGPDRLRARAEGLETVGDTAQLLVAGLNTCGLKPSDIACIVHTHLHHDHMQNDLMFPNAVVSVQRAEVDWVSGPNDDQFYFGARELLIALGDRLRLVDGDAELYGGLRVVLNAGHTPGHQSVLVDTAVGVVCICGDIVSLFENVDIVGSICPNVDQTTAFLERARTAGWEMVPSHDPRLRGHRWYVPPPSGESVASFQPETKGGQLP